MALAYYATAKIYYNGVLAYNIGDLVPDANVTAYGYLTSGWVTQLTVPTPAPSSQAVTLLTRSDADGSYEVIGLSAGTLTTLDGRYAAAGSAVGARLASASLATGLTLTSLGATLTDCTGLTISPVIGSRGVDIDLSLPVIQSAANTTFIVALIDVTSGTQVDQCVVTVGASGWGSPVAMKCDQAPAAGTRTYKVQAKCIGGAPATLSFYGDNTGTRSVLTCTQR